MFKKGDVVLINGEVNGRVFSNHIGTVVDCWEDYYTVEIYGFEEGWGINNNKWHVKHDMVSKQVKTNISLAIDEDDILNIVINEKDTEYERPKPTIQTCEEDIKYEHPKPMIQTYEKDDCPYNIELYGIKKLIIAEPHVIGIDGEGNEFISTCCREDTFDVETGVKIMCFKKERYDSKRRINLIRREIRKLEREIRSEERVIKSIDGLMNKY